MRTISANQGGSPEIKFNRHPKSFQAKRMKYFLSVGRYIKDFVEEGVFSFIDFDLSQIIFNCFMSVRIYLSVSTKLPVFLFRILNIIAIRRPWPILVSENRSFSLSFIVIS